MNRPPKGDEFRRGNAAFMMFQPSAADVPNMTIRIRSGTFWVNGQILVEYAGGMSPTITAPKSGAKWVVVVINKLGTALIVDGVARANNPEVPELTKNLLPVAMVYVKASTKAISNDMIYDVRPTLAVGGYPFQHNQLQKREEANSHGMQAITGLVDALESKLSVDEATELLAQKADAIGTTASTFTLNRDETGVPVEYCGLRVVRGDLPAVGIRFNEDKDAWEFTNDGTNWREITSTEARVPLANTFTTGAVRLNTEPVDEAMPIAVGANDPLYLSIANKVNRDEIGGLITEAELANDLANKADLDSVYTRYDAETMFITRAEYQDAINGFSKAQINEMLALKANKIEVDAALANVYTKTEIDTLLSGGSIGSGSGSGSGSGESCGNGHTCMMLTNYYTKLETDLIMQNKMETVYTKNEADALLGNKVETTTMTTLMAGKANVADVYSKAEVDAMIANGGGSGAGTGTVNGYTKGEVDSLLAGKAAAVHSHVATDVVQDTTHRMVTDAQVAAWDGKQDALGFVPVNSGLLGISGGVATLDSNGKVPLSQLPASVLGGGGAVVQTGATVVASFDKLAEIESPYSGQKAFVIDASGDDTVDNGWAEYIYDATTSTWVKTGERESLDLILDWSNVMNKPTNLLTTESAELDAFAKTADVYTKTEVDSLLEGKSDTAHAHDDRYLTADQVNALLRNKMDANAIDTSLLHDAKQVGTHEVDETNIGDGRVLAYSSATGKLVYADAATGGSDDSFKVGTKTVDETDVADGRALVYSESAGKLVYAAPAVGKVGTLDVDESALADNRVLTYSEASGKLGYKSLPSLGTHDVDETNIADGRVLAYSATSGKLEYVDKPAGNGGDGFAVFEPASSVNGECLICASSDDVAYVKNGTSLAFTPGDGVEIKWVRVRLTESEMASTTQVSIDTDTTSTATYDNMRLPVVTIVSDDDGNRALVKNVAINYNTNPHTVAMTGMAHRGYMIRVDY